ncbi:MAG TPA: histidine kinase [Thermoanaerobaculia bacterium]|nr:histidine kinase [Thermoanaerobaculia bacterium]
MTRSRSAAASWATTAALVTGGWGVAAVVYASHLFLFHTARGARTTLGFQLLEAAAHFAPWAALTPLVLRLARQWPLLGPGWPARLLLHAAAGAGIALLQVLVHGALDYGLIHGAADGWQGLAARVVRLFSRTYYANLLVYLALVVGAAVAEQSRRARVREAELERGLTQAQLDMLRLQLQPHFMFNALNTISSLVMDDPAAAQRMIARLADLLRRALDPANAGEVPLAGELESARAFLAIEEVRFGERLEVLIASDPEAEAALVPGLLLQPLLENAIRHGIARRPGAGRLELRVERRGEWLRLSVWDDGPGSETPPRPGIGLSNVTARLERLYGGRHRFAFAAPPRGGTEVVVEVPWRPATG